MGATRTYDLDTEKDRDARAVFERAQDIQEKLATGEASENVYRGQSGYKQYIKPKVSGSLDLVLCKSKIYFVHAGHCCR